MKRFEYVVIDLKEAMTEIAEYDLNKLLNGFGETGWELIKFSLNDFCVFKREI